MNSQEISNLINRYNSQAASATDVVLLAQLIENGEVEIEQLNDLEALHNNMIMASEAEPSALLDNRFHSMLREFKIESQSAGFLSRPSWFSWTPRFAAALGLLALAFVAGYWLAPGNDMEVQQLTHEVADLKEMVMLTLLQKDAATERLRAVGLTREMQNVSDKVTDALFATLNEDSNVNVRLAALDALKSYAADASVRQRLIESIARQRSPLVQVALAELMVALQARQSVDELRKIIEDDQTPGDVKNQIRQSIDVLI